MATTRKPPEPGFTPEECGHPLAFGGCWYAQIDEPCPRRCRWKIDRPEPR